MSSLIKRVKEWMYWRGISLKDLLLVAGTLGFLLVVLAVLLRGAFLAL